MRHRLNDILPPFFYVGRTSIFRIPLFVLTSFLRLKYFVYYNKLLEVVKVRISLFCSIQPIQAIFVKRTLDTIGPEIKKGIGDKPLF